MEYASTVYAIMPGHLDATGTKITAVYSKVACIYSVYRTDNRVKIQYADNEDLMLEQRRAMASLTPLRGQIDGLLDTLRAKRWQREAVGAFDRRTADALTVALQGDQIHADTLLSGIKNDIIEEQESIGRRSYLIVAAVTALVVFLVFMGISVLASSSGGSLPHPGTAPASQPSGLTRFLERIGGFAEANLIPIAAGFGALGALFSIAIGIRKRELRPDMQSRDNVIDAILRVMIGVVSAVILFSLVRANLVSLSFGSGEVSDANQIHLAIILAFVAGFVEMLVGDYITKAVVKDRATEEATAAKLREAGRDSTATELNPRGLDKTATTTGTDAAAPGLDYRQGVVANSTDGPTGEHGYDEATDGCLCHAPVADDDLTADEELPAATGGVVGDKAA